jgi:hypothetical protein
MEPDPRATEARRVLETVERKLKGYQPHSTVKSRQLNVVSPEHQVDDLIMDAIDNANLVSEIPYVNTENLITIYVHRELCMLGGHLTFNESSLCCLRYDLYKVKDIIFITTFHVNKS